MTSWIQGQKSTEAKSLLAFERQTQVANLPSSLSFPIWQTMGTPYDVLCLN